MKRSAIVALFGLVAAALGGSAVSYRNGHGALPWNIAGTRGAAAAAATASGNREPSLSRAGWEVGTEYVQSFDYRVTIAQESEQPPAGQGFGVRAYGELRSQVLELSAERMKVSYQLISTKLESAAAEPAAASAMKLTESALARPFVVEYAAHGSALQLFVQPDLDSIALGVLREIVATTQITVPAEPAPRWSALETDAAGEYRADYTRSGLALRRQKTEYVRVASKNGLRQAAQASPRIRAAFAQIQLDDWGRTAGLESHSDVATPPVVDGGGPLFVATTELRLRFISRGKVAVDPLRSLAGLRATSLSPDARDFARAASESDRALAGDATPQELLNELAKLPANDDQAASNVQVRMSALVRQQPSAIAPLLSRLDAKNAGTILGSFGAAGTPEAQKALADVTRDAGRDGGVRQAAIDSMLTLEHPTQDVPEALQVAMQSDDPSVRGNSSLMLGVMSRRLAEEQPEKAAELNQQLTSDLASASDATERLRLLGSLGNAGAVEGLPQLEQALKSPDPALRAQAASSLRFVQDPQADALLSQVLLTDAAVVVRCAALGAAAFRSYEPLATALEGAAKDPELSVRLQLVSALAALGADGGDALLLLDRMAQSDTHQDVRTKAKTELERGHAVARNP